MRTHAEYVIRPGLILGVWHSNSRILEFYIYELRKLSHAPGSRKALLWWATVELLLLR